MGAFLLIRKKPDQDIDEIEKTYSPSLDVFKKKNLPLRHRIIRDNFVLYLYDKYSNQYENLFKINETDFFAGTGSYIYNEKIAEGALNDMHQDHTDNFDFLKKGWGNYCYIIFKNNKLSITTDYTGVYIVYCDKDERIFSSSFIAIMRSLKEKTPLTHEIYEYIYTGTTYDDKTVFKEINRLDSEIVLQLEPERKEIKKTLEYTKLTPNPTFETAVEEISFHLIEFFKILKKVFGNNICSGLSGGYDSRLLLSLMRKVGIKPYLYVYETETLLREFEMADNIAKGENLIIEHFDKGKFKIEDPSKYPEIIENNFYMVDGFGAYGIFDNGSNIKSRIERFQKGDLHLNGGGGEIYRNMWHMADKSYKIKPFLLSQFDYPVDPDKCTNLFDKNSYMEELERKVKKIINIDSDTLTQKQWEWLDPFMRTKYWQGYNNCVNNQFAYSLTPYTEDKLVLQNLDVPFKFKFYGRFEAALIKFIDPALAKYPSLYGYNFYDEPPLRKKTKETIYFNTPAFIKEIKIRKQFNSLSLPYYLKDDYISKIFDTKKLEISKYVHLDKITNPGMKSRALSLELLLKDIFQN